MGLNKSKGNMYDFITHTWNTVKGECHHDCSYCYMKRWGKLNPVRFDEKELKIDLGKGNFIFVGSSCDMFAKNISYEWISKTIGHCLKYNNKYFLQTKNTDRLFELKFLFADIHRQIFSICTTFETNRYYKDIMNNSSHPLDRLKNFKLLGFANLNKYVTIEPILDFDLKEVLEAFKHTDVIQINLGADSGNNNLPEPSKEKVLELISELEKFTKVKLKTNLNRLIK